MNKGKKLDKVTTQNFYLSLAAIRVTFSAKAYKVNNIIDFEDKGLANEALWWWPMNSAMLHDSLSVLKIM